MKYRTGKNWYKLDMRYKGSRSRRPLTKGELGFIFSIIIIIFLYITGTTLKSNNDQKNFYERKELAWKNAAGGNSADYSEWKKYVKDFMYAQEELRTGAYTNEQRAKQNEARRTIAQKWNYISKYGHITIEKENFRKYGEFEPAKCYNVCCLRIKPSGVWDETYN